METIKLQKFFSECGIMSRRAAEAEILAGNVSVNGIPAVLGDRIDPEADLVCWNGKEITASVLSRDHTYVMLHKPAGYVTTMQDEKGRPTAAGLLSSIPKRLYPVGRLDMYSDGLLLFTDDGDLTYRLTHPSHHVTKCYRLIVKGVLSVADAKRMEQPMVLDGYRLQPVTAELVQSGVTVGGTNASVLNVCLMEGRNRQIRKMCEQLGWTVIRLSRLSLGEIQLGNLPSGKWRYLSPEEIQYLKEI